MQHTRYILFHVLYIQLRRGPYLLKDVSPTAESLRSTIRQSEVRADPAVPVSAARVPETGCVRSECVETSRPQERRD